MSTSDWMIILATLAGPILAIQVQKFLERGRENRNRRLQIFRTLMATRAASVSPAHVEALNSIALEFYGRKKSSKAVVEAWKHYLDHLSQDNANLAIWGQKRVDLFIDLLHKMAPTVGYEFSKVEISREIYSPKAHEELEAHQQIIREGIVRILSGSAALPVEIHNGPQGDGEILLSPPLP
ncbi:DUF6680 family protein [Neorhizobium galegae]|uniref:DUF6680 family protein n=1 Tax=Neorhizobium galegae TaxID=399 RepID=UPI001F465262|nr:DUF6680 family protein [Neorhizobium galegae]MCQ1573797.1 hypothetical protein [Neorhizobium galegae]UIK05733.1 hypothetical protein LZK81_01620 [Neorhizobium galegae]